jgi:plastocyanin
MYTGQTFSVTFDTPGTFAYYCEIHPGMIGQVTVAAAE